MDDYGRSKHTQSIRGGASCCNASGTFGKNSVVARVGALAHIVCKSTAGVSDGGGQARHGTSWDLANELADGLRLDESCQDGDEGSFGELHSLSWVWSVCYNECGMDTCSRIDEIWNRYAVLDRLGNSKETAGERTLGVL